MDEVSPTQTWGEAGALLLHLQPLVQDHALFDNGVHCGYHFFRFSGPQVAVKVVVRGPQSQLKNPGVSSFHIKMNEKLIKLLIKIALTHNSRFVN